MKDDNSVLRVTQHLRTAIAVGTPGDRMPSVRALVEQLRVSPVTVHQAMARLSHEGLIDARPGRGTFVAARTVPGGADDYGWQSAALGPSPDLSAPLRELVAVPPADAIVLGSGYLPEDLQALAPLSAAMGRAARRPGVWDRVALDGLEPLRSWFAQQVGNGLRAHDVVICPGSQAAIAAVFRALARPGEKVLVESPTYLGAIGAARAAGLQLVPVPTDAQGVDPAALERAFATTGARLFYCQPTCSNPAGTLLPAERRAQVLACAARVGAFVVEDDWAHDLVFAGHAPPTMASQDRHGHVVYLRSLTKPAAPGLRVAGLIARGAAMVRLRAGRAIDDFFVAGPLQETALQLVTSAAWPRHLKALHRALRARRDALVTLVRERLPQARLAGVPQGGLHLWMRLPDALDDVEVAARAASARVVVSAGRHWFPAEATGAFLRLSFGACDAARAAEGIERLARVIGP